MIIKFNDKVLKVGNKWVSNGFPVLNGNYLVSTSVNAVSAIPSGYKNYSYYVPIPENMGEPIALPDTYTAQGQQVYGEYNGVPISIVNDNGPDNVKNLTLKFNGISGGDTGISIGDNTFNNVESLSFLYDAEGVYLYVGNNSLNLKTEQSFTIRQDRVWKFGDNSCANLNLTCGPNGMYIFGNNSFKRITLYQDGDYTFSSGNFGADTTITPILIPAINQIDVHGDLISMIEATVTARGRRPWYVYQDSVPSVFAIKSGAHTQFNCHGMTQEQCRFLYDRQRSFINPYPGETTTPTVEFIPAS
jgi:hypothetical protein